METKKIDTYEYDAEAPPADFAAHTKGRQFSVVGENEPIIQEDHHKLVRGLKGRHMQMIAIGGAIGAGLWVGSGPALAAGGPGSLLVCFIIIGVMLLFVMQALGELAVLYPVNGAFCDYMIRFIDPSWGFAIGWDYAIQWLTVLPFELTAAGLVIKYWRPDLNVGIWIAVFLVVLFAVQLFGVRGYGETEFILSIIKIMACVGFMIFGIVVDCGGTPYPGHWIGAQYWRNPGAFTDFAGFCSVFVTASFAFGGTELVGLAAAEATDPAKQLPKAIRQVFFRIAFFYIVLLFILGLIVPYTADHLGDASNSSSQYSPFVIAIDMAGVKVLPSIFNVVIVLSVISVANSCTFASTRSIQALAMKGMAPKFLAYVDKQGRPVPTIVLQFLFALLAFINEASSTGSVIFGWLLALSGLANFFVWGSICLSHIRFRRAWKLNGHTLDELPYKAQFGVVGSWIGLFLNVVCLMASFYTAIWPGGVNAGGAAAAETFFESYLAAPLILVLYLIWKIYSWFFVPAHRPMFIRAKDIDIYTGMREDQKQLSAPNVPEGERRASIASLQAEKAARPWYYWPYLVVRSLF